jgi:hypothetical protein
MEEERGIEHEKNTTLKQNSMSKKGHLMPEGPAIVCSS